MQVEQLIETNGIFASRSLIRGENESESDYFVRLLGSARTDGWLTALKKHSPDLLDYVTNPSRLALLSNLPIQPGSKLLEVGPGYGQMTVELAKRAAVLTAIDADIGQARFCRIRLDQEGSSNATIIAGGENGYLPTESNTFDGAVMNLVLEWCATRADLRDHETIHRRILSEIYRTLTPGGFFFISTKNRYSIRLLLGGKDEHLNGLRFGSCLPRAIGNVLTGGAVHGGRLHSYPKLYSMLLAAGFKKIDTFLAMPEVRWPRTYLSATDPLSRNLLSAAMKELPLRQQLIFSLVPYALVKYIAPGLTFIAFK